ncbi:MAG TPA: hypothetical protein VNH11_10830 [Pirellulales bacterium]|nr:hypothetical protein [Pirellulales bacterium]
MKTTNERSSESSADVRLPGALIGAGGYGQPILSGIRLDDVGLILDGAVPAALLAIVTQGLFEAAERWLVPKGLRLQRS